MRHTAPLFACLVTLMTLAHPVSGQQRWIRVTVWQVEPDGSRFALHSRERSVRTPSDLRLIIPPRAWMPSGIRHRLDAEFTIEERGDSTWYGGDVTAGVVTDGTLESFAPLTPAADGRVTVEERTYRLSTTVRGGEPVLFFPFGRPQPGERGVAFEILQTERRTEPPARNRRTSPRRILLAGDLGVLTRPRVRTEHVLIEIGPPADLRTVYEGPLVPRLPATFQVANAPRGAALMVEAASPPWFGDADREVCWRWYWSDGKPPAGSRCMLPETGSATQLLYGTRGQQMRVTVHEPSG